MRRVFGPRTIVEAAFLVAVPVVALVAGLGAYAIVGASAVAYLLVLAVEATIWREGAGGSRRTRAEQRPKTESEAAPEPAVAAAAAPGEHVRVLPREELQRAPEPESESAPELEVGPDSEPAPLPVVPQPPEPEPEAERPPLVAVPAPEPEPEPEPEPIAVEEPAAAVVVPIGVGAAPRSWNVWDLERLAHEHAGADVARDEERTFLLMYLRDYADPGGALPPDFDGLVRDSFGDLVGR